MYNYENINSGGKTMSTDYDFKFGKNLRAIRMACKLTQEEFSHKSDYTASSKALFSFKKKLSYMITFP